MNDCIVLYYLLFLATSAWDEFSCIYPTDIYNRPLKYPSPFFLLVNPTASSYPFITIQYYYSHSTPASCLCSAENLPFIPS